MVADKRIELRNKCEEYALKYGLPKTALTAGLEYYALQGLAHDAVIYGALSETFAQGSEPLLDEFHTGGKDDGGIDGLLFDTSELSKVIVIQTKYKQGKVDAATVAQARDFFSRVDEWSDPNKRSEFNPKTVELLDQCEFNPKTQEIQLFFITSQTSSENIDTDEIETIFTNKYSERGLNVTCFFLTQSSFLKYVADLKGARKESVIANLVFKIQEDFSFSYENGEHSALVCAIKGNEINGIYRQPGVGDNLFNSNIRSSLKKGKINPQIEKTASDPNESKRFFFYNNGITATCTNFEMEGGKVTATNFQIVNGAQTVSSLARALNRRPNPHLYVLLRLIETNEIYGHKSEFANRITRFQNTQNPVKDSDFFSNDPIQLWLSENLPALGSRKALTPFWYQYKRGVEPANKKGQRINIEELGMLRYASLYGAPFTYKSAKDIWSNSENYPEYWKAFGTNGEKTESWDSEQLAETAWMIRCWLGFKRAHNEVKIMQKDMKARGREEILLETAYLGVFARYLTALSFYGMNLLKEEGVFSSFDDLIGSKDLCDQIEIEVTQRARNYILNRYPDWRSRVANPRLNLAQDEATWSELKTLMLNEVITTVIPKLKR